MIYKNGNMNLICIDGQNKKDALFVDISNNQLIKAFNVTWKDDEVWWTGGDYLGPIKNHIDKKLYK